MTRPVYIVRAAAFLPNAPVGNDQMESILGQIGRRSSRARSIVLRQNGIRQRYYAIDPATGATTHSNAQITAGAVRRLEHEDFSIEQMEVLACGTSSPDQLAPNHAVMVHGELGGPHCEVMSAAGICVSGVMSLKYGYLSVMAGQTSNAVVTGSETASSFMRARNFESEPERCDEEIRNRPIVAFEKDFLRWMLSDGAGAFLLRDRPARHAHSLRIEWIDQFSFAGEMPTCMYAGAEKDDSDRLIGWRELPPSASGESPIVFRQDVRLLEAGIREASRKAFEAMIARHALAVDQVDWLLPHYSSAHFRNVVHEVMPDDWKIPESRWFTNLSTRGNVGAASIYLMLEELLASGRLREGDRLLCYVPESGRFTVAFIYLRVIAV
jgi:3-oxoacyl-[acyl-carrier-protein] synthase-3